MKTNKVGTSSCSSICDKDLTGPSENESGSADGSNINHNGMSVWKTVLFVAGENAGCALLALPYAINESGWLGIFLIVMCAIDSAISGALIGKCWLILEERWPEFRGHCRYPYPAIGKMAFGNWMRIIVSVCMQITLIGSSVVVLLICAQLISTILETYVELSFGIWIIIIGAAIYPFMLLGTPTEFWPAAAAALGTTSIAVILLLIDMSIEMSALPELPEVSTPTISTISLAFGTILFAYGGTAAFPTFQNDMKDKSKFSIAVCIGFLILLLIYIPIASMGYLTYGAFIKNNVILSVSGGWKRNVALILMSGHLFFAFLLVIIAPIHEIESFLNVPRGFSWKRVVTRFSVLVAVVFLGETLPHFGKILDLIGGSTIALLSYILPPVFYLKLCYSRKAEWPERSVSKLELIYYSKIIIMGIIGGISCTIWALRGILAPDALTLPCYIDYNCRNE
ncbi:uncharacterized protein LOC141857999 [Brevipalpus obovatus]|uniref:uncharacterized protein LOC141857999 n=1 Tax=Brevipalpus obovatus TaxID=246614 RepID=UPI003D9DE74D